MCILVVCAEHELYILPLIFCLYYLSSLTHNTVPFIYLHTTHNSSHTLKYKDKSYNLYTIVLYLVHLT